jgi:hypothetical protein
MTTVAQVRSSSNSTRSARTLLLIIASHVNPDTGWAWPSLPTLAQETRLTVRRVIQLVQVLEALGELEVRRGRGRGHVNFYRVHLPLSEKVKSRAPKGEISFTQKDQREKREKGTGGSRLGQTRNSEPLVVSCPRVLPRRTPTR